MSDEQEKKPETWTEGAKNLGVDKVAVEVYKDVLQGGFKEIGKSITTVGQAVNVALSPLRGVVWSFETIENLLKEKLEKKLKDVPPEKIQPPPINIAGPTIEALRFASDEPELQELFANLLASSMNKDTVSNTHPAFVEIIKQLSSVEAQVLNSIYVYMQTIPAYPIDRLKDVFFCKITGDYSLVQEKINNRLGVVITSDKHKPEEITSKVLFDSLMEVLKPFDIKFGYLFDLKNFSNILRLEILGIHSINNYDIYHGTINNKIDYVSIDTINSKLYVTEFGINFLKCCVLTNNPATEKDIS